MASFTEYVRKLTAELDLDEATKASIQEEILAHLEDEARQCTREGLSEDEARQEALERFGDEETIALFVAESLQRKQKQFLRARSRRFLWIMLFLAWGMILTPLVLADASSLHDALLLFGLYLPLFLAVGFVVSLSRECLHGVSAARDLTANASVPNPWPRLSVRQLRPWWWILGSAYAGLLSMMSYFYLRDGFSPMQVVNNLNVFCSLLSLNFLSFAACLYWAPRCGRTWTLSLLSLVSAFVLLAVLGNFFQYVLFPLLPQEMTGYVFLYANGKEDINSYLFVYAMPLSLACAVVMWRRASQQGARWLRVASVPPN